MHFRHRQMDTEIYILHLALKIILIIKSNLVLKHRLQLHCCLADVLTGQLAQAK